jgi:hypothetical protein
VSKDCFIVNENLLTLQDASEIGHGQWLIFRYLDKSNLSQQWSLVEKDGSVTIINKATGRPAVAQSHGLLHDTHPGDKSDQTRFKVIDRGQGKVSLQCADGRYVKVYGDGLPGDVRFTNDEREAEVFLWQDYLGHDFMLLSLRNHRYLGKSPTTGSPYAMDFAGPDPARVGGAVRQWE